MSLRCHWYIMFFQVFCFQMILCLLFCPLLKMRCWNILLLLQSYLFYPLILSVLACFMYLEALMFDAYIFTIAVFLVNFPFYYYIMSFFVPVFDLKFILSSMVLPLLLFFAYCLHEKSFPFICFKPVPVLRSKVSHLQTAES